MEDIAWERSTTSSKTSLHIQYMVISCWVISITTSWSGVTLLYLETSVAHTSINHHAQIQFKRTSSQLVWRILGVQIKKKKKRLGDCLSSEHPTLKWTEKKNTNSLIYDSFAYRNRLEQNPTFEFKLISI